MITEVQQIVDNRLRKMLARPLRKAGNSLYKKSKEAGAGRHTPFERVITNEYPSREYGEIFTNMGRKIAGKPVIHPDPEWMSKTGDMVNQEYYRKYGRSYPWNKIPNRHD